MSVSLVWKEPGLGSQQKLAQVKREMISTSRDRKGIGHCGTLDPFAQGILCVGVGEGTKILSALVGLSKTYIAEMILGATSLSLDSESELEIHTDPEVKSKLASLNDARLSTFLASKIGCFEQIPPQYSAVKINGKRAFDYARKGQSVELKSRPAQILTAVHHSLTKFNDHGEELLLWRFEVKVSSGTYIRSLARDWSSELLGKAGTLKTLVRTQLGPWTMDGKREKILLGVADFSELMPCLAISPQRSEALQRFGRWNPLESPGEGQSVAGLSKVRGYLVVSSEAPEVPVALLTPDLSLQRVFKVDPFRQDAISPLD
jgi:tRNA pseudouridine(55) synthase